jgi:hypothetical protein
MSRLGQYQDLPNTAYFVTNAIAQGANLRSGTLPGGSNIGNRTGTIELWVKLADGPIGRSGSPGLTFGLFGATTVSAPLTSFTTPPNPGQTLVQNPREGVQMYAYINSLGELRISRLYFGMYWDTSISPARWRGIVYIGDGDPSRSFPRRDIVLNVGPSQSNANYRWQPNEWHHLRVSWNDNTTSQNGNSINAWLDGTQVPGGSREFSSSGSAGEPAVLNEALPHDCLFINGFFRQQAMPGGYFVFSSAVHYPGNTTIDEFISYSGANTAAATAPLQRYRSSPRYANGFSVNVPAGNTYIMGPILWEFHETGGGSVNIGSNFHTTSGDNFGNVPNTLTLLAGGTSQNVNYTSTFQYPGGDPRFTRCPSLESVYLVLYHLYPQITEIRYF